MECSLSSKPQGSCMFLKYTNILNRIPIFGLLQSRCYLGGFLLSEFYHWKQELNVPQAWGATHHSIIYAVQHITVTQSQSEGTGTLLTALIFAKGQSSLFIYIFVKSSLSLQAFSSHSYQFPLRAGLPFQLSYFDDNVPFKMIICLKFKLIKVTYPTKNILGSRTTF